MGEENDIRPFKKEKNQSRYPASTFYCDHLIKCMLSFLV